MREVEFLEGEGDLVLLDLFEVSVEGGDEDTFDEAVDGISTSRQWRWVRVGLASNCAGASEEWAKGSSCAVV